MECSVVEDNGYTYYYKTGTEKLHREDGPAFISPNGYEAWYKDGKFHREDGPAYTTKYGYYAWYLYGIQLTEEEFNERMKYDIVEKDDRTLYFKKGTKKYHREEGPAIIFANGYKAWYMEGKLHREDGPAVVHANGDKYWLIEGGELTEEEFNYRMNIKRAVKAAETVGDIDITEELRGNQIGGDHYTSQGIQPWDYMESMMTEEQFIGYLRGNVIKYVSRFDKKGGLQDIDKAMHYLEKLRSCL